MVVRTGAGCDECHPDVVVRPVRGDENGGLDGKEQECRHERRKEQPSVLLSLLMKADIPGFFFAVSRMGGTFFFFCFFPEDMYGFPCKPGFAFDEVVFAACRSLVHRPPGIRRHRLIHAPLS